MFSISDPSILAFGLEYAESYQDLQTIWTWCKGGLEPLDDFDDRDYVGSLWDEIHFSHQSTYS